ncbi:MAG TPA: glycosyltransferase family 2 protein [Nocardioidaceae bacterium]|nr:glycosyltransferase family 2 protein [Nocardioidaceae bacterium]
MLSVVVPMYNEEAVVPLFVARLRPVLDELVRRSDDLTYEVVCVDDGSRDSTAEILLAHRHEWPELRVVRLLRNAGHQAALTAGLTSARGDFAVTIDADLQDPPETIADMVRMARDEGLDVVYGVRSDRSVDSRLKRGTAGIYYKLMRRLSGPQLPDNAGDFRLISRRVMAALSALPEHGRVYRLVIPWFGFPSGQVEYSREARAAGRTKYPMRRMVALGFDSVTSFSAAPLRFATIAGLLGATLSVLMIAWAVVGHFTGGTVPGWTSMVATVGLFGGVQLLCLGLLGEYVARLFVASQQRPTYLVGFDSLTQRAAAHRERAASGPSADGETLRLPS